MKKRDPQKTVFGFEEVQSSRSQMAGMGREGHAMEKGRFTAFCETGNTPKQRRR